ncbi:uncharacterized protein LAJ45_04868 [Morchella importuna]|uniref:uncharacterized protein n=1 Tax=Morchella importuna TaxID=1174673 RepID=UPI001E8D638D|nr:uncharacterized protein LAJ45_04868 [Morchella importuna]KAH8151166.1 hypothetical protein LAJ45_04868 [Morchella importuna]
MKPTTRQVALFKSAPREYVNLSIKPPVVAAYYIDEGFHTTWVIRSKTKFQDFNGKSGLKFTISDYQFKLPEVESVSSSELVDFFGETGGAVDLILGQDFINVYSFLFYKRNNNGLQLSKSCINRTIWPDKPNTRLEIYTASHLSSTKGGVAVYTNICTPFNIWRPYKPSYWDPREDIGLFAMIMALRIVNQMPPSETAPTIQLITSDKYTWERFSPFVKIKSKELEGNKDFQNLKLLPMKQNVMLFLKYRKTYADRNCLEELTCVNVEFNGIPEYMEYARELARLGSKMSQLHFKGELPSNPNDEQYYHFDNHKDVFVVPKKEVNKTIKRILESYQDYTSPSERPAAIIRELDDKLISTERSPIKKSHEREAPRPMDVKTPVIINSLAKATIHDDIPITNGTHKDQAPVKTPVAAQPTSLDLNIPDTKEITDNPIFSQITSMFDRVMSGEVTIIERASIGDEIRTKLQEVVLMETEKALQTIDHQRRRCDSIMAGAYQKYDRTIEVLQKVGNLQGYLEGFFDGMGSHGSAAQNDKENLARKIVNLFVSDSNTEQTLSNATTVRKEDKPLMPILASRSVEGVGSYAYGQSTSAIDVMDSKTGDRNSKANSMMGDMDKNLHLTNGFKRTPKMATENDGANLSYETKSSDSEYREDTETKDLFATGHKNNIRPVTHYNLRSNSAQHEWSGKQIDPLPAPRMQTGYNDTKFNRPYHIEYAPENLTGDITAEQRAEMTNVAGGLGAEGSLEKPIISLVQALAASPDLRERLGFLLNSIGVDVDIHKTSKGLKCAYRGYAPSGSSCSGLESCSESEDF